MGERGRLTLVVLDRDGVLNALVHDPQDGRPEGPLRPQDVRLAPGAVAGARLLQDAGALLAVASNQPAAAKGKTTHAQLDAVHARVAALLAAEGVRIADWRYCRHQGSDGCACRKPAPGMLLALAADHGADPAASWMLGDADSDVAAATAAGFRSVLIGAPGSEHRRRGPAAAADLERAAAIVLPSVR